MWPAGARKGRPYAAALSRDKEGGHARIIGVRDPPRRGRVLPTLQFGAQKKSWPGLLPAMIINAKAMPRYDVGYGVPK